MMTWFDGYMVFTIFVILGAAIHAVIRGFMWKDERDRLGKYGYNVTHKSIALAARTFLLSLLLFFLSPLWPLTILAAPYYIVKGLRTAYLDYKGANV